MSVSAQRRYQRLDPDHRRGQILASAARHFADKPYPAVSVAEVAADAGLSRALVNHYFGNKRDLYLAVVESMMFVPSPEVRPNISGSREERISAVIDWLMDVIEQHGRAWLSVATAGGFGSDQRVQELLDHADDLAADYVLNLVTFDGSQFEWESARAAVRSFGGMVKVVGRELVERQSFSSQQARRILTVSLTGILDLIDPNLVDE